MDGCQTATATYPRPFGFVTLGRIIRRRHRSKARKALWSSWQRLAEVWYSDQEMQWKLALLCHSTVQQMSCQRGPNPKSFRKECTSWASQHSRLCDPLTMWWGLSFVKLSSRNGPRNSTRGIILILLKAMPAGIWFPKVRLYWTLRWPLKSRCCHLLKQ